MRIVIYEDKHERFYPLVNLFPQYRLRVGARTIAENTERFFGRVKVDYAARPIFDIEPLRPDGPTLYLSGRLLLCGPIVTPRSDARIEVDGKAVGLAKIEPPFPATPAEIEDAVQTSTRRLAAKGKVLEDIWDIVTLCTDMINEQCSSRKAKPGRSRRAAGSGDIHVARTAKVHRMVSLDASDGPIYIDSGAEIRPFSSIKGPCYIGPFTVVDRAKITKSSIGPQCRIGGEVEASTFQGFANKHHEGFIGHSYVGEWVNLGALTTNSDLKNNYGSIRLQIGSAKVETGLTKLGCFIADHTKLGIGTLIPTGCVAGSFVNFAGGGMMPAYVRDFTWLTSDRQEPYELDKAIATARSVLGRRNVKMACQYEQLIRSLHDRVRRSD